MKSRYKVMIWIEWDIIIQEAGYRNDEEQKDSLKLVKDPRRGYAGVRKIFMDFCSQNVNVS